MSRSGYSDSCYGWDLIRWRGAVESALSGKRGQAFLRELVAALDALPAPRLIDSDLQRDGDFCALGAVGRVRGIDISGLDTYDRDDLSETFGIAGAMAAEVMYINDESRDWDHERMQWVDATPEQRWHRVREWALANLKPETLIGEPEPERGNENG